MSAAVQKAARLARPVPVKLLWPAHCPLDSWKQPPDNLMPLLKVEEAVIEVMFRAGVWTPQEKVEVADLVPVK